MTQELLPAVGRFTLPAFDHSDELDQIATALVAAQGEFESVSKDAKNPFFKSTYADLPSVVKAASPVLASHGLSVSQLPGHDGNHDTLTTIVLHKSGQYIASTMQLRPAKANDPQAQGSSITYGRRYAYMAALGLVADEDDDGNKASGKDSRPAPKPAAKPKTKAPSTYKQEPTPAPAETPPVDAPADGPGADRIKRIMGKYGKTVDWLLIVLADLNDPDRAPLDIASINNAQTVDEKKAAIRNVLESLTLEQAILLVECMGGTAQDLVDV